MSKGLYILQKYVITEVTMAPVPKGFLSKMGGIFAFDFKHVPKVAWIILSVGLLIVCCGVAFSIAFRGWVIFKTTPALEKQIQADLEYRIDLMDDVKLKEEPK